MDVAFGHCRMHDPWILCPGVMARSRFPNTCYSLQSRSVQASADRMIIKQTGKSVRLAFPDMGARGRVASFVQEKGKGKGRRETSGDAKSMKSGKCIEGCETGHCQMREGEGRKEGREGVKI